MISDASKMSRFDKVFAVLAAQRADGTLCDIELQAEQQTIPAHKNILAASTPYFDAMFSGRFEEGNARVVEVKGVTFIGLKNLSTLTRSKSLLRMLRIFYPRRTCYK